MIKGMAALSSAVGLTKSFSTSDITNLPFTMADDENGALDLSRRNAVSEPAISSCQRSAYLLQQNMRLDNASRSCSTWVAVGDVSSTSQLPSPHAIATVPVSQDSRSPCGPSFSPADLVRSVNKKVANLLTVLTKYPIRLFPFCFVHKIHISLVVVSYHYQLQ